MSFTYTRINKYLKGDINNVRGSGVCDTSGFHVNYPDLKKQMEYSGQSLYWTGFLVHKDFLDKPQPQNLKPKFFGDPKPILNPRPGNYQITEN